MKNQLFDGPMDEIAVAELRRRTGLTGLNVYQLRLLELGVKCSRCGEVAKRLTGGELMCAGCNDIHWQRRSARRLSPRLRRKHGD